MADLRTRTLSRQLLARVFKDHELLKAFENMMLDVSETIPEQATIAQLTANDARARAIAAQFDVDQLEMLFAVLDAYVNTQRNDRASILALQRRIDELEAHVSALSRRVDADPLRRQLEDLQSITYAR